MPISYNPGVQDISGQLFAQNAAPGYAALAQGIKDRQEKDERDLKNGQIADSIVKTNPEFLQKLGMTEEQFRALSAQERSARVSGVLTGVGADQERQKSAAQIQMLQQHRDYYKEELDKLQRAAAQDAAGGGALRAALLAAPPGQNPQMDALRRAATAGADGTPLNLETITKIQKSLDEMPGNMTFDEDPKTHQRFAHSGRTTYPSGMNPDFVNPQEKDVLDPEGNPTGQTGVWDGKNFKVTKRFGGQLQPLLDPVTKKPIPGFGVNPANNQVVDFRSGMDKKIGNLGGEDDDTTTTPPTTGPGLGAKIKNALGIGKPAQDVPGFPVRVYDPKTGMLK